MIDELADAPTKCNVFRQNGVVAVLERETYSSITIPSWDIVHEVLESGAPAARASQAAAVRHLVDYVLPAA